MASPKNKVKKKTKALDFRRAFGEVVASGQRVWEHDRSKTVGASENFGCLKQVYFSKREPDQAEQPEADDEVSWGHTERGNLVENWYAVPKLQGMFGADKCFYMGEDQKTFVSGLLSATPDGVVVDQPREALSELEGGPADMGEDGAEISIEIKSFNPQMNITAAKARHVGQVIIQMGILQEKTNYKPKWGIVLYINPVDLQDIRPFVVKYDHKVYERAKERAARVFAPDAKPEDFVSEGRTTGDCIYCPFVRRCRETEVGAVSDEIIDMQDISPNIVERLKSLTITVATLRKEAKERKTELSSAEEELKQLLGQIGSKRVGDKEWSASVSACKGKKKLNTALMEEDGIDLEQYTEEGNGYVRLTAKVKGLKSEDE